MNIATPEQVSVAVAKLGQEIAQLPQIDLPLTHHFAPGCYVREMFMPKGAFVVGAQHKTKHLNIALTGEARIFSNGEVKLIKAPYIMVSDAGTSKAGYILEDMRWLTVHPTTETDLDRLEQELIVVTPEYLSRKEKMALLGEAA